MRLMLAHDHDHSYSGSWRWLIFRKDFLSDKIIKLQTFFNKGLTTMPEENKKAGLVT